MEEYNNVRIKYAPISERYWYEGCSAQIHGRKIRITGCWFDYDPKRFELIEPRKCSNCGKNDVEDDNSTLCNHCFNEICEER